MTGCALRLDVWEPSKAGTPYLDVKTAAIHDPRAIRTLHENYNGSARREYAIWLYCRLWSVESIWLVDQ
jgi:hypothetical protein